MHVPMVARVGGSRAAPVKSLALSWPRLTDEWSAARVLFRLPRLRLPVPRFSLAP